MATSRSNWMALEHGVLILILLAFLRIVEGYDGYSNSFISPNSAQNHADNSPQEEAAAADRTIAPNDILIASSIAHTPLEKVKRSTAPIPSTAEIDTLSLLSSNNIDDNSFDNNNDVKLSGRSIDINPSKTLFGQQHSGEYPGAPRGRSLKEPHEISPTATTTTPTNSATLMHRGRQANPDIQDIITGIVKLLNGNVNVQANTAPAVMGGRPLRPLSTRINNRGPPRIADVPALPPDFDVPAPPLPPPPLAQMPPPRMPTPYPFDLPHHPAKRPGGLYRPITIPPWRRKPTRRPPYKPIDSDSISFTTTEKTIAQDILTLDLGGHLSPPEDDQLTTLDDEVTTESANKTAVIEEEESNFEKNKEKSTSKMTKYTSVVPSSTLSFNNTDELKNDFISVSVTSSMLLSSDEIKAFTKDIVPTSSSATGSTSSIIELDSINVTNLASIDKTAPIIESSIQEVLHTLKEDLLATSSSTKTQELPNLMVSKHTELISTTTTHSLITNSISTDGKNGSFPYFNYRPRPGIVLDDTEYKPGRQPILTRPPLGDIFDITVSAIQGPGSPASGKPYVIPVDIESVHLGEDVITSPVGDEGFVSIDGKRTYLNLFGDETTTTTTTPLIIKPTATTNQVTGTGFAVVEDKTKAPNLGLVKPTQRRPLYGGRPRPSQAPPVRIDTCIVGDDSTCDGSQHEMCRTEAGVSACHCRPGHARRKHRDPCRKIVAVLLSMRVDRLYERRVVWAQELANRNSESYQQLAFEAERALDSAMSMTPFSDEFLTAKVNSIYRGERSAGQAGVFVNLTLQLDENAETVRTSVRAEIQKHLLGVIQRRSNNIGNSALWVDSPPGSISNLQDVDECSTVELNDCHSTSARCINIFGGFRCECFDGYKDPWQGNKHRSGRQCEPCPAQHCNNRGECKYRNGQEVCTCTGNYYGTQCELDGEVLGVAIGASVAAVIIIGLTLVCLVMWSRRWSREQKASAVGSPVFGYMATASNTVKAPIIGAPPYQLTMEDRLRWAQLADVMAQANHYAPEPVVTGPTRPSSALFGYPNLSGTMHGTLPPVPLPRLNLQAQMAGRGHGMIRPSLDNSSSSEEEDKADLLGRNFQVPRPKSRSNASIANQSGIYYDVDYDQNEIYKQAGGIPLSTYSMGRPSYYRN